MTSGREVPGPGGAGGPGEAGGRLDNGLRAPTYVPLTDVEAEVGEQLLSALGRARIAAYLIPAAEPGDAGRTPIEDVEAAGDTATLTPARFTARRRLFVASDDRVDARTIVAAAVRALGGEQPELPPAPDPLAEVDTDAAFSAIVADWHVDTIAAVRDAERDLTREDSEWRARLHKPPAPDEVWLDEDHYVPPPPPPLPRLAAATIAGITVLALSVVLLGFGAELGLASDFTLVLGIGGLLLSAVMLLSRVREHHRDEDDDGSAI